jgi:hypothetical protein
MRRSLTILILALGLGIASYLFVARQHPTLPVATHNEAAPELEWLKTEYQLSNDEFARICAMHNAYMPGCTEMCREIKEKNAKIQALIGSTNLVTPEIEHDLKELADLRLQCQLMMLRHFYEVSKTMPPAQGQRYIAEMQKQTSLLNPDLKRP